MYLKFSTVKKILKNHVCFWSFILTVIKLPYSHHSALTMINSCTILPYLYALLLPPLLIILNQIPDITSFHPKSSGILPNYSTINSSSSFFRLLFFLPKTTQKTAYVASIQQGNLWKISGIFPIHQGLFPKNKQTQNKTDLHKNDLKKKTSRN